MLNTYSKKIIIAVTSAVLAVCLALGAWLFAEPLGTALADGTPEVETESNGKVTLGELCERHDVIYAWLPGGTDYLQKDESLKKLADDGRLIVDKIESRIVYNDSEGKSLAGWNTTSANSLSKVLVVLPNTITEIKFNAYSGTVAPFSKFNSIITGLAFEQGSTLSSIPDANFIQEGNITFDAASFGGLDQMRFCILPESLKTIGVQAFSGCNQLQDMVMPGVREIKREAFKACANMFHISIPATATSIDASAFKGAVSLVDVEIKSKSVDKSIFGFAMNIYGLDIPVKSYLRVYESYAQKDFTIASEDGLSEAITKRMLNNSFIFNFNTSLTGALATTNGGNISYTNKWYFIGLDGIEDKAITNNWYQITEYRLPEEFDLASARRYITYDFIGSDGTKYINNFTGQTRVTSYDINKCACSLRAFTRIFFPKAAVKVIGDYAFLGSQITYVDIAPGITHIGTQAFRGSHREPAYTDSIIYIRKRESALRVGNYVFAVSASFSSIPTSNPGAFDKTIKRKFIFDDRATYLQEGGATGTESNLKGKYNKAGDNNVEFTYQIPILTNIEDNGTASEDIFAYRLAGYDYDYILNENGYTWSQQPSGKTELPVIEGSISTVWYNDASYSTAVSAADISRLTKSKNTVSVSIYTRRLGNPSLEDKEYTYDDEVSADIALLPAAALGFTQEQSENYQAEIISYIRPNGDSAQAPDEVQNAGTYKIKVRLSEKWGEWIDDNEHNFSYTVEVHRAEINLGDIANMPVFAANGSELGGDGSTIYRYPNGSGAYDWYLYQRTDAVYDRSVTVTNSYARFTGDAITLNARLDDGARYTLTARGNTGTASGEYSPTFVLEVINSNYIFVNNAVSGQNEFTERGITFADFQAGSKKSEVEIYKRWYIVVQQNWLIDSEAAEGSDAPFVLLTKGGEAVNSFEYEALASDEYRLHIPKAANGGEVNITFSIALGNEVIVRDKAISDIERYINAAMPAGSYTVTISAAAVGSFPAFNDVIRLTVAPARLQSGDIEQLLGISAAKTFEHVYNEGNAYLFDEATQKLLDGCYSVLNGSINSQRTGGNGGEWGNAEFDEYYKDLTVTYNLDRLQTTEYFTQDRLTMPRTVGKYIVYYSLAADNYTTVGGTSAANRRDYAFNTIIFREISTSELSVGDVTYTGMAVYPSVPYSQYYGHSFIADSGDFVNAGSKKVLFTVNDPELTRWVNDSETPANVAVDGATATVTFEILKADNEWNAIPQIPSWSFNGFDADINVISSSLRFGNVAVSYSLSYAGGGYVLVDGTVGEVGERFTFTVSSSEYNDGGRVDAATARLLNRLKPGTYYLESTAAGDDNINELQTAANQRNTITIGKANNRWTETPNVIRWAWGSYDKSVNTIGAAALYPEAAPEGFDTALYKAGKITYSIYAQADLSSALAGLDGFTEVTTEVESALKALPYGAYVLRTSLAGTDYYSEIESTDHVFNVSKAVNVWTETPNVIRWAWGSYDKSVNLITAVAEHNSVYGDEVAPVILFTVLYGNGQPVSGLAGFTVTEGVVGSDAAAILGGLDAGTYYIVAAMEGRRNYTAINPNALGESPDYGKAQKTRFEIEIADNSWETTPKLTNWQYTRYSSAANFVAGVPHFPTEGKNVIYGIYGSEPVSGAVPDETSHCFTDIAEAEDYLDKLGAGSYYFVAYVAGEENKYNDLWLSATFTVNPLSENAWTMRPAVTDWVYGEYNNNLTDARATLGTAVYTVKGLFEGLAYEAIAKRLSSLDAGDYVLEVSVEGTDDYPAATSVELRFTVSRAKNAWREKPSIEGWVYGSPAKSYTEGETVYENGGISYKYYVATRINGEWIIGNTPLDDVPSAAGNYALVATAAAGKNYAELKETVFFDITPFNNGWSIAPEDALTWEWGAVADIIENSSLYGAAANMPPDGGRPVYKIVRGKELLHEGLTSEQLPDILKALGVGQYTVTTLIEGTGDYSSVTKDTVITVMHASYTWSVNPENAAWTWTDTNEGKELKEPEATGIGGARLELAYSLNGKNYTIAELRGHMSAAVAGEYKITVSVKDENYSGAAASFTVTITPAKNKWTAEPTASVEVEYGKALSAESIVIGVADFGTAVYKYGNETLTATAQGIADWFGTARNMGKYTVNIIVAGEEGKYDGLTATLEITVKGIGSEWSNGSLLKKEYSFGYSNELSFGEIVIPLAPSNAPPTASITYTVYKNGEQLQGYTSNQADFADTVAKLKAYLDGIRPGVGGYSVKAAYNPHSENYASLEYTVSITVSKAATEWTKKLNAEYINEYQSFAMASPENNLGLKITYTLNGAPISWNGLTEGDIAAYLNTLDVGNYELKYSVDGGENYNSLAAETVRIVVSKAANRWINDSDLKLVYEFTRGQQIDISVIPEPLRGELKYIYNGGTLDYKDNEINSYLNGLSLAEGEYEIVFTVSENKNYYGIRYPFKLRITRQSNSWITALPEDYKTTYSGKALFEIPVAALQSDAAYGGADLLRFDIVKAGGGYIRSGLTEAELREAFLEFANGTYTVTMRVGALAGAAETDENILAYNRDYETLSATVEITVEPDPNGWAEGKRPAVECVTDNTQGKYIFTVNKPEAKFGNDKVTYLIIGREAASGSADITSELFTDFDAFRQYIEGLNAGSYTAIIGVAATDYYGEVSEAISFTVNKITTAWSDADTLEGQKLLTWTWGSNENKTFVTPAVANWSGARPVITLTEDGTKIEIPEGATVNDVLKKQAAGKTYVVRVAVAGDKNHTELVYEATVIINRATREWVKNVGAAAVDWVYGAPTNSTIEYLIADKDAQIIITVNNAPVSGDIMQYLNTLGFGNYVVTATVPADDCYEALTESFTLRIARAANAYYSDGSKTYSMCLDGTAPSSGSVKWVWANGIIQAIGWQTPVPVHGSRATLTVTRGGEAVFAYTLTYTEVDGIRSANQAEADAVIARLCNLDAGSYVIAFATAQDSYYDGMTAEISFTVERAVNGWLEEPEFDGWQFGGGSVYPTSKPKYGNANDVLYFYAVAEEGKTAEELEESKWSSAQPTATGSYFLRAILAGTDNYGELKGYSSFSIGLAENNWVDMPGVIGWAWGGYEREINLFRGSARNGGRVTFKINAVLRDAALPLTADDFSQDVGADIIRLLNEGFGYESEGSKYISPEIANALKYLKPNGYRLFVTAAADENYSAMNGNADFEVGKANNAWVNRPNVLSYTYLSVVTEGDRPTFTAGAAVYGGRVHYRISGITEAGDSLQGAWLEEEAVLAALGSLNAGRYSLEVWVEALIDSPFNDFYSEAAPYQVQFNVMRAENGWRENKEPVASLGEIYYSDLKSLKDIGELISVRPEAKAGEVRYTLLNPDYTQAAGSAEYGYENLLAGLQSLKSGDYVIRLTVDSSGNYIEMSSDMSLSIRRKANGLNNVPERFYGQWAENDTTLEESSITAMGGGVIVYRLNGAAYEGWEALKEAAKYLAAGSYQVIVEYEQTDEYEGVSVTVQLDISAAENAWLGGWAAEDSLSAAGKSSGGWSWGTEILWARAVPKYGNIVYVEIKLLNSSSALHYITVDYGAEDGGASAVRSVGNAVSALDRGVYEITVTAPADFNWRSISGKTRFEITTAENRWTSEPALKGAVDNKWTYGGIASPVAEALYGTVRFEYYINGSSAALAQAPVNSGSYEIRFIVDAPETGNYMPLERTVGFEITKAEDKSFVVSPGATGWTWGGYDRGVNLFTGVPVTGGSVRYSVLSGSEVVSVDGVPLENIALVNEAGIHTGDPYRDLLVPEETAELLAKLTAGDYELCIIIGEVENYAGFSYADVTLRITVAPNEWLTTARVTPWSLGSWSASVNTPHAEARFGYPDVIIKSKVNGDIYYSSVYNAETGLYEVVNRLGDAPAGWYVLEAEVKASEGRFNGLTDSYSFQVFVQGSPNEKNYWNIEVGISSWIASVSLSEINMPEGEPLRGLPYFVFYERVFNGTEYEQGAAITASDEVFVISAGSRYFRDFYIPKAPGTYYMRAYAQAYDLNGELIEEDALDSRLIEFEIRRRVNSWSAEPRIPTLLYLGEVDKWEAPTAAATEAGSVITYTYRNKLTGESYGSEMPKVAGRFILTATAEALYCSPLVGEVEFSIELSANSWISAPTIKEWSAEFAANEPVAEAAVGTEYIVYTYARADAPNNILNGKPTAEGEYILYAVLKLEGYETLTAEYRFTISPAFDTDFLIVDIVLGTVAVAMGIAVMCIAIRRYREC